MIDCGNARRFRGALNHRHFARHRAGLPRCFFQNGWGGRQLEKLKHLRDLVFGLPAEILVAQTMDATGMLFTERQDLLLVERPTFNLLLGRQPQPKIPVASRIEALRTHRHRKWVTDDVEEMRVGKMLEDEIQKLRVGVLEGLLVADPEQFGFLLGREERRADFHQSLLHGQEILARALLATEQVSASFHGVTQPEVRVPRVGVKWLGPGELVESPDDVRFMGDKDLRVQVQHPDQL